VFSSWSGIQCGNGVGDIAWDCFRLGYLDLTDQILRFHYGPIIALLDASLQQV